MGKKFSVSDLDSLLNDAIEDTDLIQKELEQDQELIPQQSVSPQIANMVNQKTGATVDFSRVYKQLEKLIQNGNVALQVIAAIDPDVSNGDIASSTASLMNAIRNCVAQFTKIHLQHIKFQQTLQLMKLKHQMRMEEIEKRGQVYNKNNNSMDAIDVGGTQPTQQTNGNVLVPYNTENVMDYMNYLKQKQGKV